MKEEIRKRDNYTCQVCYLSNKEHLLQYNYQLVIHHIDYVKQNCKKDNLITLCHICHNNTNRNRQIWPKYLEEILKYGFSNYITYNFYARGFVKESPLLEIIESKFGCIGETPNVKTRTIPREVVNDPVETTRRTSILNIEDDIVRAI